MRLLTKACAAPAPLHKACCSHCLNDFCLCATVAEMACTIRSCATCATALRAGALMLMMLTRRSDHLHNLSRSSWSSVLLLSSLSCTASVREAATKRCCSAHPCAASPRRAKRAALLEMAHHTLVMRQASTSDKLWLILGVQGTCTKRGGAPLCAMGASVLPVLGNRWASALRDHSA